MKTNASNTNELIKLGLELVPSLIQRNKTIHNVENIAKVKQTKGKMKTI